MPLVLQIGTTKLETGTEEQHKARSQESDPAAPSVGPTALQTMKHRSG